PGRRGLPGGDDDALPARPPGAGGGARRRGAAHPPSLDREGFVHCSTRRRLAATLARHFAGAGPLVALVVDREAVAAHLRWAESHPGELFPHVHAPIPVGAIVAVELVTAPAG